VVVDPARLALPQVEGPLVVEGAGGLMVPITADLLFIDLFERWNCPVVLVARTALGTINHSLLSIEALHRRQIPVLGVAFVGEAQPESEAAIARLGKVARLGRLPILDLLDARSLAAAFTANFRLDDFR
jgi:dethiobiotin synthetase